LIWPRLESTIFCTRGEHDNHYTIDVVFALVTNPVICHECGKDLILLTTSATYAGHVWHRYSVTVWNKMYSLRVDISLHSGILSWFRVHNCKFIDFVGRIYLTDLEMQTVHFVSVSWHNKNPINRLVLEHSWHHLIDCLPALAMI
jgi:hypothetical protein